MEGEGGGTAPEVGGGGCGLGGAEKEEEGVGCQNWKGKVYIKGRARV